MLNEDKERREIDDELIEEYAEFLGLDKEFDRDLFWIAKAGLDELLPESWRACQIVGSDDIFYYNAQTQESRWTHPCDEGYLEMVKKELEERVTVALTLTAQAVDAGLQIVATNLAGTRAAEITVEMPDATSMAEVLGETRSQLTLADKAVPRFILRDGRMLGHSSDSRIVSEVFGL